MSKQQNGNKYKRILLKLSGEELLGERNLGIDPKILDNNLGNLAAAPDAAARNNG